MSFLLSRSFLWLLEKEMRELLTARAWWVLLLVMGPLTGVSFISALRTYAEVSGLNGTSAGVGEALAPLIGVWAPTFSACELAAVFLLPFVAIRIVAADRQNGVLKLELQQGMSTFALTAAKAIVVFLSWLITMLPPLIAIVLWKSYGGTLHWPELLTLLLGHFLNAGITIALGAATASITEHPSTAAILTLSVTVGTWIINFFGAIQGGLWERAAAYTPAAMVADFQHGLLRLDTIFTALSLTLAGLAVAAIWMRLGIPTRRRGIESLITLLIATSAIAASTQLHPSWDHSENRANSFPLEDEQTLRRLRTPLAIEVHLAAEDPRRVDFERKVLSKLRRLLPNLRVTYQAETSIGLFEQTREGYGEIWYYFGSQKAMSRATTEEAALETIYTLTGLQPPQQSSTDVFRGHPLAAQPTGAPAIFYLAWPLIVLAAAVTSRKILQ